MANQYGLNGSVDATLLQKTRANMEKPKALQFRNNTGNRGYGFVANIDADRAHLREDEDYLYEVRGNRRN